MNRRGILGVLLASGLNAILPNVARSSDLEAQGINPPSVEFRWDGQKWLILVNVSGPFVLVVNGSPVAGGIPPSSTSGPANDPNLPHAWGSVTVSGQKFELKWDNETQRLWFPNFDQAKALNRSAPAAAHVHANFATVVEALGRQIRLEPGQDWFYQFPPNDPSFGFAARPA